MSKAKGSRYEREFVAKCDELGLPAEKMPLSGALGGKYSGDVLVADEWRIECKYRKDGAGFKRLYGLFRDGWSDLATVCNDDVDILRVQWLETWAQHRILELTGHEPVYFEPRWHDTRATFAQVERWAIGADYLAVRMPRHEWLIVEVL